MQPAHALFLVAQAMCCHPSAAPFGPETYGKSVLRTLNPIYTPRGRGNMTLEHVVPRSLLARSPPGAARDLHNVFCTTPRMNSVRSNMRFEEALPDDAGLVVHAGEGNFVDRARRTFSPHPDSRGVVARAALYMIRRWGCDPEKVACGGERTLWRWHAAHPPGRMELLHNYLVLRMQKTTNPLISNVTDPDALLELATRAG